MDSTTGSTSTDTATTDGAKSFDKGTWQEQIHRSVVLRERGAKANKQAANLLWTGAQEAITEWEGTASDDVSGEGLYNEVLDVLGKPRKGDASKIKTVAVAVRDHGLVLSAHPSLTKAYAEARRLTQTLAAQADEDDAAEKAVSSLDVPKTASTEDSAARLLLGKGIDGAVVAILDALGRDNEAAHKSFMRAVSTEIAARVQARKPKPAPKPAKVDKGDAKPVTKQAAKAPTKPKVGTKAKPVPVSASKGDPNKRPLPPTKAKAAPVEPSPEGETSPAPAPEVKTKAKPVVIKR